MEWLYLKKTKQMGDKNSDISFYVNSFSLYVIINSFRVQSSYIAHDYCLP